MKCTKPVIARKSKWTAGSVLVPCGRCIACRLNHASTWSTRIMHESKFHEKSVFVTLTYNEAFVPRVYGRLDGTLNGSLEKDEVQMFVKRLRKAVGKDIRYYFCGEYGPLNLRPHYHAVIFGLGKDDRKVIEDCWRRDGNSMGSTTVEEVTQGRCDYIARYVVDKLNGPKAVIYEKRGVIPEFALMSRKPGIGAKFADRFSSEIFNRDGIFVKGRAVAMPRYYESRVFVGDDRLAVQAERKALRAFENHKKAIDKISSEGYSSVDGEILNERLGRSNALKDKICLRKRKN